METLAHGVYCLRCLKLDSCVNAMMLHNFIDSPNQRIEDCPRLHALPLCFQRSAPSLSQLVLFAYGAVAHMLFILVVVARIIFINLCLFSEIRVIIVYIIYRVVQSSFHSVKQYGILVRSICCMRCVMV